MEQNIYLALRFHTNFYHSYRGDTPDEKGFGKDIRIITSILDDLDRLNGEGIPVQGTWDIENFFSLEKIMPAFSPELIGRLQERVKTGRDAVAPMSWNNGIVSVSTEEEFDQITRWTISNPMGSGLADLFDSWEPVLRPQECMYTPSFLKRYPEQGIQAISLYYSAHPFNGFSNFMPELSLKERYNPLRVVSRDQGGEMIMVPAYNNGDVADHWLSLRRWIKSMRREQLATPDTGDLLLLIDMDADDEFWSGMEIPLLTRLAPSFDGLYRMIRSLDGLDYLKFITAGEYLKTHKPAGTIELNQDTADGSRDGLSSWAEKWSNTHLWTLLNESRRLDRFTDALGGAAAEPPEKTEAREMRLKSLTTTHFGLSSPVMNRHRLQIAGELAARTAELSAQALKQVSSAAAADTEAEILLPPGTAGGTGLVRLRTETHGERKLAENPEDLQTLKGIQLVRTGEEEAGFLYNCPGGEAPQADETGIRNGLVSLESDKAGNSLIRCGEASVFCMGSSVSYNGKALGSSYLKKESSALSDDLVQFSLQGEVNLGSGKPVLWQQRFLMARGLPYVYADVLVEYPETAFKGYNRKRAENLDTGWDARWEEVRPIELIPFLDNKPGDSLRIWKHNFFGDVSSYDLNYHSFSGNRTLDSFNNHITNGWVAASSGTRGLLVAQSGLYQNNFAFCPMRLEEDAGLQRLKMNPMGTYTGKQMRYQTSASGLGRILSLGLSDHLDSYAPSYNGRVSRFSLMLAPYEGDRPGGKLQQDAMLFAQPPLLL